MLLLYQIIITITCWHHLFQITSLFNQFTSLLALNCSCPNFFWNVLQVWMTGKDVYLQMTWSWPDKTLNILCSYCLQWNTSQSKFRNHYFLFLFAFSILSQLFLIWGCNIMYHMLIRGMWVGCIARVKCHNWHKCSDHLFSWQNQYNAIILSTKCKLFHIPSLPAALGTSHACASNAWKLLK